MKATKRILAVISIISLAAVAAFANPKGTPPGKADTFYRGVTTIAVSSNTTIEQKSIIVASRVETRFIGGNNNIKQDRLVSIEQIEIWQVTTTVFDQHHGTAHSKGAYIGSFQTVEKVLLSSSSVETVGDWGPAYEVPSGVK